VRKCESAKGEKKMYNDIFEYDDLFEIEKKEERKITTIPSCIEEDLWDTGKEIDIWQNPIPDTIFSNTNW